MDNAILIIPLIASLALIVAGVFMSIYPPRRMNYFYGYRTPRSMKTYRRWKFAQRYAAQILIKIGGSLLVISVLGSIINFREDYAIIIGFLLMVIAIFLVFYKIETAIKKQFPE